MSLKEKIKHKIYLFKENRWRKRKRNRNKYFIGRIRLINPINLQPGSPVITPQGAGFIKSIYNRRAEVRLERKYNKSFNIEELKQYVVYNHFYGRFVMISGHSYPYVYKDKQIIEYRLTMRDRAMLTDFSMDEYEHVKSFTKVRYGRSVLDSLEKKGYKLKRHGNKNNRTSQRHQILRRFEIKYLHKKI